MNLLVILGLLALVLLGYATVHALRHDGRPRGATPPRSHPHDYSPAPWYASPDDYHRGTWAA